MEHVQVHPTGFVDPADPTAGTKVGSSVKVVQFGWARVVVLIPIPTVCLNCKQPSAGGILLMAVVVSAVLLCVLLSCVLLVLLLQWLAPEKLRGCGAILLNSSGQRFVDELTTRDKVTDALMQQVRLCCWCAIT